MPSFGQKLKLEREKRSITLEQISSSTKIGTRMLQALEDENFGQLPGGIFDKGFVRAYARHVGLDEDQAVADYLEASGQGLAPLPDSKADGEFAGEEPRESAPTAQIPWGWLAAGLLVIALALFLWSRWHHKSEAPSSPPAPASSQTSQPTDSTTPSKVSQPLSAANPVPSSPEPRDINPPKPATANVNSVLAASSLSPSPPSSAGELTVVILARDDSWLSISADGKTVFEDTLVAENQRAVRAQKELVIRAGNTGALDFVFNGKKLPSQGDYGEVKTLTFGITGLQSNAPAKSVTP